MKNVLELWPCAVWVLAAAAFPPEAVYLLVQAANWRKLENLADGVAHRGASGPGAGRFDRGGIPRQLSLMPRTRRDLIRSMWQTILQAAAGLPDPEKRLAHWRQAVQDPAQIDFKTLPGWLDEPISDEEFARLSTAPELRKMLQTLLDPSFFPSRATASIDGQN